jgi:hypothetical protein
MKERPTPTLGALSDIKNELNALVRTIVEYQEARARERHSELKTESGIIDRCFVAIAKYYESENAHSGEKSRRERQKIWLERAGVGAAIILAILTFCTLHTLNVTNTLTKTQFEAEHRPWVGNGELGFKDTQFLFYPTNAIGGKTQFDVTVDVPIKNSGVEPALHVATGMDVFVSNEIPAPPNMDTEMQRACGQADGFAKQIGEALFPNSDATKVERSMDTVTSFPEVTDIHRVWVFICIAYSSTRRPEEFHHTKIWAASWPITGQPREASRTTSPPVVHYTPNIQWIPVVKTEAD